MGVRIPYGAGNVDKFEFPVEYCKRPPRHPRNDQIICFMTRTYNILLVPRDLRNKVPK